MPAGAPFGNTNAKKGKMFEQAVRLAMAQEDWKALRECAETLRAKAVAGEPWAVQLLRDTLDGKPAQTVELDASPALAEGLSAFAAFVAQAAGEAESRSGEGLGESGPLLPDSVPPTTH
jgi:hypothetical protein